MLARSGVRDEQELLERRGVAARQRQLERVVEERAALVAERLDWEGAAEELAHGDVSRWEALAADADVALAAREREVEAAEAGLRGARAACDALENADEVPTLELEWAALTAELEEAVRDWRVLAAAAGFVEDAEQEFERTRQPAVLREASRAFATVTGDRYERVSQDENAATLVVVERDGLVKQAGDELSRGTAEALYLACASAWRASWRGAARRCRWSWTTRSSIWIRNAPAPWRRCSATSPSATRCCSSPAIR